jgi:steroid delta-isomerase-like uncharacterized protein
VEEPLDIDFVRAWGGRCLDAWNAHDAAAVAAMCSEDILFSDPALPEPVRGRERVREYVASAARAFPDYHLELVGEPLIAASESLVLCRFRMTGTMLGDWEGANIAATGARIDLGGVDEWIFRGEELCRYATHYDSLAMSRQLGVLPPANSRRERTMAQLQHVQARLQRAQARRRSRR